MGPGPSSSGALSLADLSSGPNGLNSSSMSMELSLNNAAAEDKMGGAMPDLSVSCVLQCSYSSLVMDPKLTPNLCHLFVVLHNCLVTPLS